MELIESEPSETAILPEPEPRYHTANLPVERSEHGQTWLRTLAMILAAIILVVLIVFFARWVYHKVHHTALPVPSAGQQSPATSSSNTASGAPSAGVTPAPSGNPSQAPGQPAPNPANPAIANTGPDNVAAIFIGTSLAAYGLHFIVSLRRSQSE